MVEYYGVRIPAGDPERLAGHQRATVYVAVPRNEGTPWSMERCVTQ